VKIAKELIALQEILKLSVLLFTNLMRHDLKAYTAARGAIGIIASYTRMVYAVMSDIEWDRWEAEERALERGRGSVRKDRAISDGALPKEGEASIQTENANIHEPGMQSDEEESEVKVKQITPFSDYAGALEQRRNRVGRGEIVPEVVRPF
jgi:hypothetical protein